MFKESLTHGYSLLDTSTSSSLLSKLRQLCNDLVEAARSRVGVREYRAIEDYDLGGTAGHKDARSAAKDARRVLFRLLKTHRAYYCVFQSPSTRFLFTNLRLQGLPSLLSSVTSSSLPWRLSSP